MRLSLFRRCLGATQSTKSKVLVAGSYARLVNNKKIGKISYGRLMRQGNFGIGTFDHINGEMIAVDGKFYCADKTGHLRRVSPEEKSPFALITQQDMRMSRSFSTKKTSLTELQSLIITSQPSKDTLPMALRVEARIDSLYGRSVENTNPSASFQSIMANEHRIDIHKRNVTLVGFYFPEPLKTLTSSGFHFHFVDEFRQMGGHLHDCQIDQCDAYITTCDLSDIIEIEPDDDISQTEHESVSFRTR